MSEGKHLTNEGLKLIKEIKYGINSCRHCPIVMVMNERPLRRAKVQIEKFNLF